MFSEYELIVRRFYQDYRVKKRKELSFIRKMDPNLKHIRFNLY